MTTEDDKPAEASSTASESTAETAPSSIPGRRDWRTEETARMKKIRKALENGRPIESLSYLRKLSKRGKN